MPINLHQGVDPAIIEKAKGIRLLALDVDGVLTDGKLYFSAQGDELKAFNILDGHGIKMLLSQKIEVAIITGRVSPIVARRAHDLGLNYVLQGREDKKVALQELSEELGIPLAEIAYVGDDLPDLAAIVSAGLGIGVANAHAMIKQHAHLCTKTAGGQGAIREVCDFILEAKNLLSALHQSYLN